MSAPLEKTKTPGIFRRGGRYVVVYRDPQGRQRKRSAATLAQARDLKAALRADVVRGEYRPLARTTFGDYAPSWIRTYQGRTSRGIRPETVADYARDLERDAIPFFGGMRLAEIEPRTVKAYAAHIAARGLAPNTVRLALAPVRALLATAHEEGLIRSNPAAGLRIAQRIQHDADAEQAKALTAAELRRLLAELPPPWRLFVEFIAHTGLRISEAVALRWGDIDLGHSRVQVRRRRYLGNLAPPKSRFGRRDIPLTAGMTRSLWELRKQAGVGLEAPLFPSKTGAPLDPSNVFSRVFKPAARRAGVPWAGFHTLRHTCATMLFRQGYNAKQVQVWLGHHSPAFTLATYVHLLPDDLPQPRFLDHLTAPSLTDSDDSEHAIGAALDPPQGGNEVATRPSETRRDDRPTERRETAVTSAFAQ